MKRLVILSLALLIFACQNEYEEIPFIKIEQFGSYNSYVYKGDQNSKVELNEYSNLKDFYALGILENQQGVITIINSEPYVSNIDGYLKNRDQIFDQNACFFVSSVMELWTSVNVTDVFNSKVNFDEFLIEKAIEQEIDPEQPFPFLLEGKVSELNWKLLGVNPTTESVGSERILTGSLQGEMVRIIGFFDKNNKNQIAEGDNQVNMNFIAKNGAISGHVVDFITSKKMVLRLPKKNF